MIVAIRGDAASAGSMPTFSAHIGKTAPISFDIITVAAGHDRT